MHSYKMSVKLNGFTSINSKPLLETVWNINILYILTLTLSSKNII